MLLSAHNKSKNVNPPISFHIPPRTQYVHCTLYILQWGQGRRQSTIQSVLARIRPELMRETWLHIPRASEVPCFVAWGQMWFNNFTHGAVEKMQGCTKKMHLFRPPGCAEHKGVRCRRRQIEALNGTIKQKVWEHWKFFVHTALFKDTMIQWWIWQHSLL